MAFYTYDAEADALYVLLSDEQDAVIARTEELAPTLHVDLDAEGGVIGIGFLYPRTHGVDTTAVRQPYGIELDIPFSFAA